MAQVFTDSADVLLDEDIDKNDSGLRKVPGAPGLQWSLTGFLKNDGVDFCVGAYIQVVGGNATVSGTFFAFDKYQHKEDRMYKGEMKQFKFDFNDGEKHGIKHLLDGSPELEVDITCNATFTLHPPKTVPPVKIHDFVDPSNPDSCDTIIKIGQNDIKVSRCFLMMVSAVFKAMFAPDSEETKTCVIEIADFTYETVKNALDYCYGHNVDQKTTSEINDMICFYAKFNIQPPIEKLQFWLKEKAAAKTAKRTRKSSFDTDEPGSESSVETDESDEKSSVKTDEPAKKSTGNRVKRAKN